MSKSILIDTNILMLLIVGLVDRVAISRHKRTREFNECCFKFLMKYLKDFNTFEISSYSLAEVSNLLDRDKEHMSFFIDFIKSDFIKISHIPKDILLKEKRALVKLGVTDCSILIKSKRVKVLTKDLELYSAILQRGNRVDNFIHLATKEGCF